MNNFIGLLKQIAGAVLSIANSLSALTAAVGALNGTLANQNKLLAAIAADLHNWYGIQGIEADAGIPVDRK